MYDEGVPDSVLFTPELVLDMNALGAGEGGGRGREGNRYGRGAVQSGCVQREALTARSACWGRCLA